MNILFWLSVLQTHSSGQLFLYGNSLNGTIPTEIATEVAEVAGEFVAAEKIVLDYVQEPGTKTIKRLVEVREEFTQVVTELLARVCRR